MTRETISKDKNSKHEIVLKNLSIYFNIILGVFMFILVFYVLPFLIFIRFASIELTKIVLDNIKIIIWPSVIIYILVRYGTNIIGLINGGTFHTTFGDFQFSTLNQKPQNQPDTRTFEEKEELKNLLKEKEKETSNIKNDNEKLNKELILTKIELDFEKIFRLIFSNQITLLHKIEDNNSRLDSISIARYFEDVKKSFTPTFKEWSLQTYLEFLLGNRLIVYNNDFVEITLKGKVFLSYLKVNNLFKIGM